jgi:hypothetical protein
MVLIADFIGKALDFRIKNIEVKDNTISAYAGYESGSLSRVAIVNLDVWNPPNASGKRPMQVTMDLTDHHISTVEVQKLTGPGVDSFENMT